MPKLFDKILVEKIKKVFNSHKENFNPSDWNKLKVQLTGKKRTPVIWLNIAKAASVVLFVGVSTFYVNRNNEKLQSDYLIPNQQIEENSSEIEEIKNNDVSQINNNKKQSKNINNYKATDSLSTEIKTNYAYDVIETESIEEIISSNKNDSIKSEKIIVYADSSRNDSLNQIVNIQSKELDFEIDEKKRDSRFDFAIAVSSMYSYSTQGAKGQMNMAGGFTTSYNISKKFSISTGLMLAQQVLDYNSDSRGMEMAYSNAAMDANIQEYANTTMVNNPKSAETRIEFVGIDIPLNVKYKIKRLIVTTGISSLVFVNEKRTYSTDAMVINTEFNESTNSFETKNSIQNFQTEEKSTAFNRVDFASLLNIAVAYEIPLKKGRIMLEPFLKYPIGEISSANLKIGSGGLSLYYSF